MILWYLEPAKIFNEVWENVIQSPPSNKIFGAFCKHSKDMESLVNDEDVVRSKKQFERLPRLVNQRQELISERNKKWSFKILFLGKCVYLLLEHEADDRGCHDLHGEELPLRTSDH